MVLANTLTKVNKINLNSISMTALILASGFILSGCADAVGPNSRNAVIPAPKVADERQKAINEGGEPVIYLPLGEDVLLPQSAVSDTLPDKVVGPYELRGETLAGALQLIMDGVDIPIAFESEDALTKTITITNLKGPISRVVNEICALANMYCSYNNGILSVKDREIFTVTLPPIVAKADIPALLTNVSAAIGSITGEAPITDPSTRTIVYRASQRTAEMATRYFQRLRSNTAMIIYETYIWEVALDSGNSTGIKWSSFDQVGRFKFGVNLAGVADTNIGTPISIGLPTTGNVSFTSGDVFQFISSYGAVKTISQPQISVLSGSDAKLRVADKQNYVASVTKTTSQNGNSDTFATTTASVDTGFTLDIGSNWDNSTVYGTIEILLQEVQRIQTFDENPDAIVQLPQTTERELSTSVRVRPGDMILIGGLVRQSDKLSKEGIGLAEPFIPTNRSTSVGNTELVFLMRPRVVVFTTPNSATPRKGGVPLPQESFTKPSSFDTSPFDTGAVDMSVMEEKLNIQPDVLPPPVPAVEDKIYPETSSKEDVKNNMVQSKSLDSQQTDLPSIEIQPLRDVVPEKSDVQKASGEPSVIVNYDVLGR